MAVCAVFVKKHCHTLPAMNEIHEQHLVQIATVIEVHPDHSLVKVSTLGKPSGWLPVLQQANRFKKQFIALRVDEQVMLLASRYVLRGIYHQNEKEPSGSGSHVDITEYEDGTRIEYSTQEQALTINAVGRIQVSAPEVHITGVSGDVVVDGISLVNHTHPQNAGNHFGGGTNTGKPQ